MTPVYRRLLARLGPGTIAVLLGAVGLWLYAHYVWYGGKTLAWTRPAGDYELLAPRMLAVALLAPYFLWMIGKSLADLPLAQRVMSVCLRIAFVVSLSLGLARPARTATTQKICTVMLVDVSDSISDAALEQARIHVEQAFKARAKDDLVRVVTFAKRPRLVAAEGPTTILERHCAGLGAGTDIASALELAYGLYPTGYLRRALILSDGVQTSGVLLDDMNTMCKLGDTSFSVPASISVPVELN